VYLWKRREPRRLTFHGSGFCYELADADNDFRLTTKRNAGAAAAISLMVQRAHFSIRRTMSARADKPWH
jgi:hypothetical protein